MGAPGTVELGEPYGSVALRKYVHVRNHPLIMYMVIGIRELYGSSIRRLFSANDVTRCLFPNKGMASGGQVTRWFHFRKGN